MQFESQIGDETIEVSLNDSEGKATVNGSELPYSLTIQENGRVLFRTGTKLYKVDNISVENQTVSFSINGKFVTAVVKNEEELMLEKLGFDTTAAASIGVLEAPMPGKILELLVAEGNEVEEGDPVIILEAMKMENELKAPTSGKVVSLEAIAGNSVEKNQILLEIEPRG
ncbi:MAG: acetyl-CoA carboxylase biotin carboxyl carrier protein subunit [Balneolaceae bacterium]|nr:acetyl-CoA carboxylase biotin carboxyl carrier protein subunit [Balneolaceae bacterium]MCH8548764.1 biotin/lipoyl-binding protein [Balneolaceae bacterium]